MSRKHGARPLIPRFVRMFSVPIVLFWFGLVVVLSVAVPPLEQGLSIDPDRRGVLPYAIAGESGA